MIRWFSAVLACLSLLAAGVATAESTSSPSAPKSESRLPDDWLVGGFDRRSQWITAGLVAGLGIYLGTAETDDIRDLGDITQLVPGAFGLTSSFVTGDTTGLKQFGFAAAMTAVTTHGVKAVVDKTRPDGSEDNSFPSGHTSASVMGAAYVWRRYGASWGAPASVLAVYTGASRIVGQKHFADDVISGAALGLISNLLWTSPIDDRVRMSLLPTDGGMSIQFAINTDPGRRDSPHLDTEALPHHYFWWEMGLVDVARNSVAAPNPGGTLIDWRFDQEHNPSTTGFVGAGWSLTPDSRHGLYATLSPFEVREGFTPANEINFAGAVFQAGLNTSSRYVANDYRIGYGYDVVNNDRFRLIMGGSVAVFDTLLKLSNDSVTARVTETLIRPTVGARLQTKFAKRWLFFAGYHTWRDSEVAISDATAQLGFVIDENWALSLGYRYSDRKIDTEKLFVDTHIDQVALGIWYLW